LVIFERGRRWFHEIIEAICKRQLFEIEGLVVADCEDIVELLFWELDVHELASLHEFLFAEG